MNTYLCTRNQPYQNHRCLGHNNPEARQGSGYYPDPFREQDEIALMQEMHPDDTLGFTVESWIDDLAVQHGLIWVRVQG
jgi:hypothetical protein